MTVRNLEMLLAPRSLALVGASARPGSLGAVVLHRLSASGFRGPIGLVNPKYRSVGDRPCVAHVRDLDVPPDLGVVVTPASAAPEVIGDLGAAGARAAVVISAGFTPEQRQRMLDAARPHCLRILGPNCIGLQVPRAGLDASFAHMTGRPGNLALLSQSGAIVTAMIDWAETRAVGFSVVASMGDMSDVDVGDLLDHLASDRHTRAILMYLEGVTEARKFMSAARSAARAKPVIAIKAGRSASASRAAASHTGALAGADDVYEAAFARAGVLRVDDLQDLFDAAEALARHRPLAHDRLAVLTNGGGAGVLAVDALARTRGRLADLAPETIAALDRVLPPSWSRANPVDIIGDAGAERYGAALEALLRDRQSDAVLVLNCPTGLASSAEAAEALVAAARERTGTRAKPLLASWIGGATAGAAARTLEAAGVPTYATPGQAVGAFDQLVRHRKAQLQLMRTPPSLPDGPEPDRARAHAVVDTVLAAGRTVLTEPEAKAVLAAYAIETVPTQVAADPREAAALARQMLDAPTRTQDGETLLAVKLLSPDITHKSDVGGVRLNLASPEEVEAAAEAMLANAHAARPQARLAGVVVQPMVRRPHAFEVILGINDDPTFGPVMLFGAGGTAVEVMADRALALPPLDGLLARDMIDATRIGRLLAGYRDRPPADLEAIAGALVRLSQLAADMPHVRELDINPLLADADGIIALDARIAVAPAERVAPGGNPRLAIRPYPSAWDRRESVGGTPIRIRPIRPDDEALYPRFLARVSAQDMKRRFFSTLTDMRHEDIARLTQIDYGRAMGFVAIDEASGDLLGVARVACDPDGLRAEYAALVRSDCKGHGIGWALMNRLKEYAADEGIEEIYGEVMADNEPMLTMARELGFEEGPHPEDITLRRVTLRQPRG